MRFFVILFFLIASYSYVSGSVVFPKYNSMTVFSIADGDSIILSDFPSDWKYKRVAVGINGSPLQGTFVNPNTSCEFFLSDYYKIIDFQYRQENSVILIYRGKSMLVGFLQWWVDNDNVNSTCSKLSDGIFADSIEFLINKKLSFYSNLKIPNQEKIFENSVGSFRIQNFQSFPHNDIVIQVESKDGKPLEGYFRIGKNFYPLSGYSISIPINRRSKYAIVFQVAFNTIRKYSIKWWGESREPKKEKVHSEQNIVGDTIFASYLFTGKVKEIDTLHLKIDKNSLADGKIPSITCYSSLPTEITQHFSEFRFYGTAYEISGKLSNGKKITVALPLGDEYEVGDSIGIFHYSNGVLTDIEIDSVAGNFIYFKTDSFSLFGRWIKKTANKLGKVLGTIGGGIIDGIDKVVSFANRMYDKLINFVCGGFLDGDMWKRLFHMTPDDKRHFVVGEISAAVGNKIDQDFAKINDIAKKELTVLSGSEITKLEKSQSNLDILLANLIIRKRAPDSASRHFVFEMGSEKTSSLIVLKDLKNSKIYPVEKYFLLSSDLTTSAENLLDLLSNCYGAVNLTGYLKTNIKKSTESISGYCKSYFHLWGISTWFQSVFHCGAGIAKGTGPSLVDGSLFDIKNFFGKKDDYVLLTTEVLSRAVLLSYYSEDEETKEALGVMFKNSYDALSAWAGFMGAVMLYNNISIKAEAAMALYEYIYSGSLEHFNKLKQGMINHYGPNGGFSEGMGYAQYVNETVPYLMVALRQAMNLGGDDFDLPQGFLNSGEYIRKFSRSVRLGSSSQLIPIEIDDGCTYPPDFYVWGTLTKNKILYGFAEYFNSDTALSLFRFLGLPDEKTRNLMNIESDLSKLIRFADVGINVEADFLDGLGVIKVFSEKDTASISLIAENGILRDMGQAHDQQDNISFTLASTSNGFFVQDRGYKGFKMFDKYKNYSTHNVIRRLCQEKSCDEDDAKGKSLSRSELSQRATAFTGYNTGVMMNLLFYTLNDEFANYGVLRAGGSDAYVEDSVRILDGNVMKLVGFSARQTTTSDLKLERSICYFGETLWLVDRLDRDSLLWNVNSRIDSLSKKMAVYFGKQKWDVNAKDTIKVVQNRRRKDTDAFGILRLNEYSCEINHERLVTLIYPMNKNIEFQMDVISCPKEIQCFERKIGEIWQRVVISPLGNSFIFHNAFPGSSDISQWTGIVFGESVDGKTWTVVGNLNGESNFQKLNYGTDLFDLPALKLLWRE